MKIPKYFYFRVHIKDLTSIELEDASDVDIVEVVRCCDCKYYTYKHSLPNVNCKTKHCTRSAHAWTKPDDYCSYGERGEADD